nr:ATP-binding protein [Streptomyces tailanensis]
MNAADPPSVRRRAGTVLDRWPFRRKLNVLVIAPVVVVGVLLGIGVNGQLQQAWEADRTAELVRDSGQVTELITDVQAEHRQALVLALRYESARPGDPLPSTADYREAQRNTDAQMAAVRSAFGSDLPDAEEQALEYLRGLGILREKLERSYVPAANIDPAYASAVDYLIDGIGLDGYSDTSDASEAPVIALLETVLRADASHAAFESAVFSAQTRDANALTGFSRAVEAHRLYAHQADRFSRIATPDQVMSMDGIRRSSEQNGIEAQFAELRIDPSSLQVQTARELRTSMAAGSEQAQTRLGITRSLMGQIADRAETLSADALNRALLMLALALLGFAVWLAFCVLARRSVVRPLAALTGAAQQVIDVTAEELARVTDAESDDSTPLRPREIPVPVRDEIGELAEAFNQVQVTAAALLERQVLSRRNVAEMFGNVGRRVSNLTTRQLALIDAVEREETDPELLDQLYRVDHIAVRLQRNADSLMLLAGIRESEVDARPTTLANVIRASLGQIEGYRRVSLRSETEVTVAPDIIGDLTLMLAELLENAVSFSPSHTPVEVVVRPGTDVTEDGGALIEVIDHGLGMSAERLVEENARLIRRERLDLVPTRMLGLFVVGSLARRSGIRVSLSRTPGGGVTGTIWIPSALLMAMSSAGVMPSSGTEPTATGTVSAFPTRPGQEALASATPAVTTILERRPVAPVPQGGLPRRVPPGADAQRDGTPAGPPAAPPPSDGPRPLRRRVRGATLATTVPADRGTPAARQAVDADAVRSELDEFEAAVRRAEQDSAPHRTEPAPSQHPESQEESGSDHVDR